MLKKVVAEAASQSEPNDVSATQQAYLAIRRMLVIGELQPGEKLKIGSLKDRLNTGASPIREALSLLTSDHLVERIDQRGFRAAEISLQNFEDILKLRCALEEMALRQSIDNATEQWEEQLVLSHHRMLKRDKQSTESFESAHKDFHMALLANCESPILLKYCSQLYDLNIRYRYIAGKSLNYKRRKIPSEHQQILDAAVSKNSEQASTLLLSHYRKTGAYLADLLSSST